MLAQHKWIKPVRLVLAFLLTPVIMLIWLSLAFDVALAYCGMDPDGPALIGLGFLLVPAVLMTFLFGLGLAVFMAFTEGHLSFRATVLPAVPVALISGLLIYLPVRPWGDPAFAPAFGVMAMLGVIVATLCFYLIGVWRTVPKN
jgi:hypothetical protein